MSEPHLLFQLRYRPTSFSSGARSEQKYLENVVYTGVVFFRQTVKWCTLALKARQRVVCRQLTERVIIVIVIVLRLPMWHFFGRAEEWMCPEWWRRLVGRYESEGWEDFNSTATHPNLGGHWQILRTCQILRKSLKTKIENEASQNKALEQGNIDFSRQSSNA